MNEKIFVGVDCHKKTIACYVNGKFKEVSTTTNGFKQALKWAPKYCCWAIEGAYHYGLTFATFLLEQGCEVYEFNALATAKARSALSVAGEKNDYGDAKAISIFAPQMKKLQKVSVKTIKLSRLLTQRKLFVKQRVELINNLKAKFIQKGFDKLPYKNMATKRAIKWLLNNEETEINTIGKLLKGIEDVVSELDVEIEQLTPEKAKELTKLTGIGSLTASTIYAQTKDKNMTKAQFASYCGVSPVPNSSGQKDGHRNNKRGDRVLNSILFSISNHQAKYDKEGSKYFLKKLTEGKTKRHAKKCLSRQICNQIWKILFKDSFVTIS